eukprot:939878-Pyramimonas_sp.AAC.1
MSRNTTVTWRYENDETEKSRGRPGGGCSSFFRHPFFLGSYESTNTPKANIKEMHAIAFRGCLGNRQQSTHLQQILIKIRE